MSEDDKTPAAEPPADPAEPPTEPAGQPTSQQSAATEASPWPAPVAAAATVAGSDSAAATPARPRFFDRVVGMRAVAAVALASVLVGGAGGAALGALSNGDDDHRNGRFGGPMTNFQGPSGLDGNQLPPPGMQGQLPPGLPPSQDDESNS